MRRVWKVLTLCALLSCLEVAQSNAGTVYYNNFQEGDVGSEWSSRITSTVPNPDLVSWGRYLGQFSGNDSAKLSLAGLPKGRVTLSFDTYFIRSWDGDASQYGPDRFMVTLGNGASLLDATFSNGNPAGQSYVGNGTRPSAYAGTANSSMTGSAQQYSLGYFFWDGVRGTYEAQDSVYNFSFSFLNSLDTPLEIIFAGLNLQGNLVSDPYGQTYYDESWGLDNVRVEVEPVPEPSTLLLLAGGAAIVSFWRGRRYGACRG